MSDKELQEYIKRISPRDLKILRENISEDFYITYINNIYDIHRLIKKYCEENGILIYDKVNDVNDLCNYIQKKSNYSNEQLEIYICEKMEEEERERMEEEDDFY